MKITRQKLEKILLAAGMEKDKHFKSFSIFGGHQDEAWTVTAHVRYFAKAGEYGALVEKINESIKAAGIETTVTDWGDVKVQKLQSQEQSESKL